MENEDSICLEYILKILAEIRDELTEYRRERVMMRENYKMHKDNIEEIRKSIDG